MNKSGLTREQGQTPVRGKYEGETEVAEWVLRQAYECVSVYNELIGPIRQVAKKFGYAIGLHGSLARDIDLIAVPWTEDAVDPEILATGISYVVKAFNKDSYMRMHGPEHDKPPKPHGRLCWSIFATSITYIDLSVMPRIPKVEEEQNDQTVNNDTVAQTST
jgi:hypothetical protein